MYVMNNLVNHKICIAIHFLYAKNMSGTEIHCELCMV